MNNFTLSQLVAPLNAEMIGVDTDIQRVVTDSRKDCDDALFIALKGPYFDAHQYLQEVVDKGAKALLVNQRSALDIPQLVVEDTLQGLTDLAEFNRAQLAAQFVAITGSCGKTTVKEMLSSILQQCGSTFATRGNLNNHIGVPLSLLEMDQSHQYGILELGANQPGDISHTVNLVKPQVALINNVAAAHLEGFGDLMGVARAKGEIYESLKPTNIAVINDDDEFSDFWKNNLQCQSICFSVDKESDVFASDIKQKNNHCFEFNLHYKKQSTKVSLPIEGEHNVANAVAAAACALALEVDLATCASGLANTPRVSGRLMPEQLANGCLVIDDTYNANLASVEAAIDLLKSYNGRRILVIGDMAELGESGRRCHQAVGLYAQQAGIDALYSCGVLTQFAHQDFNGEGIHFNHQQQLIEQLKQEAKQNVTLLIKGSRSAHMETVVTALMELSEEDNAGHASSQGRKN